MDENERPNSLSNKERSRLAFAVLLGAVFGISCMSFSIERNPADTAGLNTTIKQHGSLVVNDSGEGIPVYYPRPFVSPPNLKLDAGLHTENIELLEQKPDHFTVRLKNTPFAKDLAWFAQGIPLTIPLPPAVVELPPPIAVTIKEKTVPPPPEPIEIPTVSPKEK